MEEGEQNKPAFLRILNYVFSIADNVILIIVAVGLIYVAGQLIYDAMYDALMLWTSHTIPHLLSEMMFTLIIMELFRQVWRQINKHKVSLNPFLCIGFIARIRGLLLTQMSLSMGDIQWEHGTIQMAIQGVLLLILVVCYVLYNKNHLKKVI